MLSLFLSDGVLGFWDSVAAVEGLGDGSGSACTASAVGLSSPGAISPSTGDTAGGGGAGALAPQVALRWDPVERVPGAPPAYDTALRIFTVGAAVLAEGPIELHWFHELRGPRSAG